MKIRKILPILALSLAFTGCGQENKKEVDNKEAVSEEKLNKAVEAGENQGNIDEKTSPNLDNDSSKIELVSANDANIKISPVKAYEIVKENYKNPQLESMGLNKDSGTYLYDIEIVSENEELEIKVNPLDGSMQEEEKNTGDKENNFIDESLLNNILEYVNKALNDAGSNYSVNKWSLDLDDGIDKLEVELTDNSSELEYTIDPKNGEILEKEN